MYAIEDVRGGLSGYRRFLAALKKVAQESGWIVRRDHQKGYSHRKLLRRGHDCACPITAVCEALTGKKFKTSDHVEVERAARAIRLPAPVARKIVDAADNYGFYICGEDDGIRRLYADEEEIRADLLSAVGLPIDQ